MNKIKSRLRNFAARCIVNLLEGSSYQVSLLNGETCSDLEHLQEYGFTSKKPTSSKANGICLFYGGNRANGSLIVIEVPELKPEIQNGECAIFNSTGSIVKLVNGGYVHLNGSSNLGIVKIVELTTALNLLVSEIRSHTHGTGPVPSTSFTSFVKTQYENQKVVH